MKFSHSKSIRYVLAALTVLVLFGCGDKEEADVLAPSFTVMSSQPDGKMVKLGDYKGKVVIVDFWATWCGPCRSTMPTIQKLYTDYKARGVDVVAISDEPRSVILNFRRMTGIEYPMFIDNTHTAGRAYGVKAIPQLYIIGKTGKLAYAHEGGGLSEAELRQKLEEQLKS